MFGNFWARREACKAWNHGCPDLPNLERDQVNRYATYWAVWARQVDMNYTLQYSPKAEMMSQIDNKAFWREMLRQHGPDDKTRLDYWHRLVGEAAIYGNLSVMHAYSEVMGHDTLMQELRTMAVIHPRILSWRIALGEMDNRRHLFNLDSIAWDRKERSLYPNARVAKPGDGDGWIVQWVQDWLKLPEELLNQRAGVQMCLHLHSYLNEMNIPVGSRQADGCAQVDDFYRPQQYLLWGWGAGWNFATPVPLQVAEVEGLLQQLYTRFDLDPVLLDTVAGRWAPSDVLDPKVCAIVLYMHGLNMHNGNSWRQVWGSKETRTYERRLQHMAALAQEEPVLSQALQWQTGNVDEVAIYQTAVQFFRPTMEPSMWDATEDVGSLFEMDRA